MREILFGCITTFVQTFFVTMTISSIIRMYPNYRHYGRIYKSLRNRSYCKIHGCVFAFEEDREKGTINENNAVMWIIDINGFVLADNVYLINSIVTCFCPYSFYWLVKYQLFFKRLLKSNKIPDISHLQNKN